MLLFLSFQLMQSLLANHQIKFLSAIETGILLVVPMAVSINNIRQFFCLGDNFRDILGLVAIKPKCD